MDNLHILLFCRSQVALFVVKLTRKANAFPLTITLKKFISWGISRGKGTLKEGFQASSKVLIISKDSGGHTLATSSIKTRVDPQTGQFNKGLASFRGRLSWKRP